ncbi:SRPBCC family protein [Terrabacter carboxydivorans]|uniref:Polyketide cyclase / dehydrase and lipid transport n=1 Tax=Terrabacter carboxydivorans TaxID=619730 RepID=A0ABN3MHG1_9MICO
MATLTRSITIHAPVSTVFALAADISKLWRAEDVALAEVDIKPEGVGTSARMFSHVLGFHIEGGLEYTEFVPQERIVAQVHFFAEKPTWTFTFHEADGGGTTVTAVGEWVMKVPVVGKPVEQMMVKGHESFLEGMLAHLKTEAEAQVMA